METYETYAQVDAEGYQKLGPKAFYFLLFTRSAPVFLLLVVECAIFLVKFFESSFVIPGFLDEPLLTNIVDGALLAIPTFFLLLLFLAILVAFVEYSALRYRVDENGFDLERGIFSKERISLPFKQVQNVDVEQSVLYRIFGMANVVILTAGHEDKPYASRDESEVVLPAISFAEAQRLQRFLLERANVQEVVAAPQAG